MKKVLKPLVVTLIFIAALSTSVLMQAQKPHPKVVLTGNFDQKAIDLFPHAYQCSRCKMEIVKTKYAVQITSGDGKTRFFDDIGCMANWLEENPISKSAKIWVYALDSKKWIDAKSASYTTDEKSPMHFGFGAYEYEKPKMIDFESLLRRVKEGKHMANPSYRSKLLQGK